MDLGSTCWVKPGFINMYRMMPGILLKALPTEIMSEMGHIFPKKSRIKTPGFFFPLYFH
jgi:hypothetical protein